MDRERKKKLKEEEQVIKTVCAHHCGGSCIWNVHVRDGVVTRLEPDDDPKEDQLRGCLRGHALRQQLYAPDRLKYPLKRVGPRGAAEFERISWDEALDTVAAELIRIKETYGNASILSGGGCGNVTLIQGMMFAMARLLYMFGGFSETWGWPSWEAATFASSINYGTIQVGNSRDDLVNSRLIILWGVDPAVTIHSTNTMWYLARAREAGAKIISIDPRYTKTAATVAEQWIPIIPSTDAAMAIAMAYVMITENLQDQAFLDCYSVGFDKYRDYVLGKTDGSVKDPRWAEQRTGVSAETIAQVARDYATIKPGALISGISPGRTAFGEQFHRATATLAAMTGNIGIHGGEPASRSLGDQYPNNWYQFNLGQTMLAGPNPVDKEAPTRPIAIPTYKAGGVEVPRSFARVHQSKVSDAILRGKSGGYHADYKAFVVYNHNFVNQFPSTKKWQEALNKLEFMLVLEQFMTATARYADIVLPTCTILERNDLIAAGNKPFYGYFKRIVEPLHESKSQYEICTLLAERMGIGREAFTEGKTDEEWAKQIATGGGDVPIEEWDSLKENSIYRMPLTEPCVSFKEQIEDPENNPFPTPSGKIEIYSQLLADKKDPLLPPIPMYFEPWEGRTSPLAKTYPLQLITVRCQRRSHTQFETIPWLRELVENKAQINTKDAEARDIRNDDMVKVYNNRGEIRIRARVTERIVPGVVNVPQGAWFRPDDQGIDRGGCPNTLNSEEYSPCGSFTWNTALVEVEKAYD
jgi:anaerobic dimethyl sulfoxide reductase subunit A